MFRIFDDKQGGSTKNNPTSPGFCFRACLKVAANVVEDNVYSLTVDLTGYEAHDIVRRGPKDAWLSMLWGCITGPDDDYLQNIMSATSTCCSCAWIAKSIVVPLTSTHKGWANLKQTMDQQDSPTPSVNINKDMKKSAKLTTSSEHLGYPHALPSWNKKLAVVTDANAASALLVTLGGCTMSLMVGPKVLGAGKFLSSGDVIVFDHFGILPRDATEYDGILHDFEKLGTSIEFLWWLLCQDPACVDLFAGTPFNYLCKDELKLFKSKMAIQKRKGECCAHCSELRGLCKTQVD